METVYLGLGGNLLTPYTNIKKALSLLEDAENIWINKISSFYQTSPVSPKKQEDYLNLVCSVETTLSPLALLEKLEEIEKTLGKIAKGKNDPRIIDIDILFFGE